MGSGLRSALSDNDQPFPHIRYALIADMPLKAYGVENTLMSTWTVEYAEEFEPEYLELVVEVRVELTAQAKMIERFGPTLGRQGLIH